MRAKSWFVVAGAVLVGCADVGGTSGSGTQELTFEESLVARGEAHELDTVRVPPPGDFIEHEAAGFAKVLCSAVFLTGLDFEDAQTWIGGFTSRRRYRDRLPERILDRENGRVHVTTDTGVTRSAALHGDQGCVALPKGEEAPFFDQTFVTSALDESASWPMGDAPLNEPLPDDVDAEKLAAAVAAAFEPDAMTLAFLVLHRGRLIAERYREGIDKDTPLESWSMNKSLTATLMGVLIEQGEYALDEVAPVDAWHEDPNDVRGTIRIRDILRMSSGLRCVNAGDPEYDEAAMGYPDHLYLYTGTMNSHLWATERPPQWPPNTIGRYRNCDPILVNHLVRLAVEDRGESYHEFPQKHLFDRIGVRRFVAETDPYGNFLLNGYGFGSGRAWARLGQLYLDDGVAPTGERVLPEGFVTFVSTPAPAWVADGRPIYGGFFWINNPSGGGSRRYPSLPESAFSMQGAGGQSTIILPSHEMVVVRLGLYEGSFGGHADAALQSALAFLVEAIPATSGA